MDAFDLFSQFNLASATITDAEAQETPVKSQSDSEFDKHNPHCIECGSFNLIKDHGHSICRECGTDLGPVLQSDEGSMYHDSDKSGTTHRLSGGTNSLLQKSSLGTSIGGGSYRFQSMMRYHRYNSMPYKERSQWKVFKQIKTICEEAFIPKSISDEAQRLYKKISESCNTRGKHRQGLIASCLFYACKYEGVPRTSKEIANLFHVEYQDLTKAMKKFRELIHSTKDQSSISTALDYVPRFCDTIGFTREQLQIAECMVAKCYILNILPECTSISLAATIMYCLNELIVHNKNITKTNISKLCGLSEVTILKCYRKLQQQDSLKLILPNEFSSLIGSG